MNPSRILSAFVFLSVSLFFSCKKANVPKTDNVFRFGESIVVDGRERTYIVNLPPNYYEADDFSLVIGLHGGGGSASQFETSTKLTEKANTSKFIVLYPDGVQGKGVLASRTWNAGSCCDYASENNIDDIKFISLLIDKVLAQYKINSKRVYVTGHSNGGMLSYRLACELSNKIAAAAPNASTMVVSQPCNASRPVAILHMHSILDNNVPYQGGKGSGFSDHYNPPVDSVLNVWQSRNQCAQTAKIITDNSGYKFIKWFDCTNNVAIHYYLTKDGGHSWPGGKAGSIIGDQPSNAINANDVLWDFFQQHQLR